MAETDFSQNVATRQPPGGAPAETILRSLPWLESLLGIIGLILRRLAFGLLILLSIIFFSYFGLNMARGASFGEAVVSAVPDTVEYVGRLLTGELGTTTAGTGSQMGILVSQVIVERLPRSLGLLGISLFSATLIGVTLGVRAARRRSKRSLAILMATIIGISVPSFFGAFLLQWAVITFTRESGQSLIPVGGFGWDAHLILPVLVLAARPLAQITRITHSTVRDVSQQDYVRTARSKGLRRFHITNVHVMRNAAIPILTTVGVSLHFALSSLPIVELYFGWPGIGFTLLGAIARQDDELAIALLLCIGILVILVNIILEVSYRFIDPRVSETPSYLARGRRQGAREVVKGTLADMGDYLTDNPVTNWLRQRLGRREPAARSGSAIGQASVPTSGADAQQTMPKGRLWPSVWNNFPLVVGGLLVLALVVIVFFGSYLSPHDPYTTRGLELVGGEMIVPPFAPGAEFPLGTDVLGRDMLSLLFTGAQLTLTLVLLSVLARMGVGILTGAVAGWTAGSWLDRIVMGLAEIIAAFPALLLAMILILALGIRQGMWPFIVALTFVGWGDTMQYVRSEVVGIRPRSFIESAVAIGARTPRIVGRHILPNLLAPLISIFALEMGAVLMLLGELGFLSIFIGGGAFIGLDWNSPPVHYSDVPEWGALLSTIRVHSRSFPWLAVFPTLAFFLAILGFNLFGEGVRRLVEDGSLIINRVINRYTVLALLLAGIAFAWFRTNSGTIAFNRQHAQAFSGEEAMTYLADLSDPGMDGRALGTDGLDRGAAYVAEQFEALGLQPAGSQFTYFQERFRSYAHMESPPQLSIADGGPEPAFREDYAYYPGRFMSDGEMSGAVRFVGFGEAASAGRFGAAAAFRDLRFADYSDEVVLVLSDRDANVLSFIPRGGMLVVVDDPVNMRRRVTQPGRSLATPDPISGRERDGDTPSLWISEEMANRILAPSGQTVSDLRESIDDLDIGAMIEVPTGTQVSMKGKGTLVERLPVQNVIGHLPGNSSANLETKLDHEMIVVLAQYDSPAARPGEAFHSAANDNASGVAVMLEAIRVLQETEYRPNRTFLFVAYSGEGLEGGENVINPNVERFLQAKVGFATSFDLEAIVHLRGLGAGDGDRLEVSSGGSYRLAELFETAGGLVGVDVVRSDEPIDISVIFDEGSPSQSAQDAPEVRLSWEGWSEHARMPDDTPDQVSAENLEQAGRALALALMQIGQERQY